MIFDIYDGGRGNRLFGGAYHYAWRPVILNQVHGHPQNQALEPWTKNKDTCHRVQSSTESTTYRRSDRKPTGILLPRFAGGLERAVRQPPQRLRRAQARRHIRDVVAAFPHELDGGVVVRVLETYDVRQQLIVQARFGQGLRGCEVLVEHVPEVLDGGGDDAGAAGGADGEVEAAVCILDDGGRDG